MSEIDMKYYSAALDEVYRLRVALAVEASSVDEILQYKSLPAGAREIGMRTRVRMRRASRGEAREAYIDWLHNASVTMRRLIGADVSLTRAEWEAEVRAKDQAEVLDRERRQRKC